ncbi:DUF535 family protein [Megasphaera micronuciformis]|nr:DUF535 family protein [Megasphaera micronuciformis]
MLSTSYFWNLSKAIYRPRNFREQKRAFSFFCISIMHKDLFREFYDYFDSYEPMKGFFTEKDIDFQESMTRVFLYKNSTMRERLTALEHHFDILRTMFTDEVIHELYWGKGYTLWESPDPELPLVCRLIFDTGQRKEGFLSLYLYYENEMIYHFNFRFDYNKSGVPSLYVGTLQGSKEGLALTKVLTKKLFGYRPKNFILYLLRIFTQTLGMKNLYVITDEGFYTNSHLLRGNRSKKTNFNDFWKDEGAFSVSDEKMYWALPIEEKRRTYSEIKSQKRNLFRKRYLLMDTIIPTYIEAIKRLFRPEFTPVPSAVDPASITDKPADYDPIEAPRG